VRDLRGLPSMIEAEQYLLCESLIALSTIEGFKFFPRTTKCMWILVNTLDRFPRARA